MSFIRHRKWGLTALFALGLIGASIAYYLIPKPPETRFIERWKINADETLRADPEFQSLKGEAQAALRLATQESLTAQRYEFTEDGLLLFGREGQLLHCQI